MQCNLYLYNLYIIHLKMKKKMFIFYPNLIIVLKTSYYSFLHIIPQHDILAVYFKTDLISVLILTDIDTLYTFP